VSFAIQHFAALLNRRLSDGLRQVALSRSSGTEKQCVFALVDEGAGGEVEDQTTIHLGIKAEVEIIERAVGIAESGLFATTFQQPVGSAGKFVRYQARDEVNGSHGFGLSLAETGFEH
jgi:hypothetical protein